MSKNEPSGYTYSFKEGDFHEISEQIKLKQHNEKLNQKLNKQSQKLQNMQNMLKDQTQKLSN
jgi:hypothetical protein